MWAAVGTPTPSSTVYSGRESEGKFSFPGHQWSPSEMEEADRVTSSLFLD